MDVTGAWLKVARAREHQADLRGRVGNWRAEVEPPRFKVDVEDGGRTHIVRLVDVPTAPVDWSPILGDMLHNLRSALDLVAWQAVLAGGGNPGRATCFPVLGKADGGAVRKALRGAAPELVDGVLKFQPYARCSTPEALRNDALWVLHRLDIEDKHRLVVMCARVVKTLTHNMPVEALGCTVTVALTSGEDGAEVLRFSDLPSPLESVAIEPEGQYDIWVAETDETAFVEVMGLDVLFRPVESVIEAFERHG